MTPPPDAVSDRRDTAPGKAPPEADTPRAARRLATVADVRIEAAKVYREARERRLAVGDASRLVYILTQIAGLISTGDLEQRIAELERIAARKKGHAR